LSNSKLSGRRLACFAAKAAFRRAGARCRMLTGRAQSGSIADIDGQQHSLRTSLHPPGSAPTMT
jgi:hypothetical protein